MEIPGRMGWWLQTKHLKDSTVKLEFPGVGRLKLKNLRGGVWILFETRAFSKFCRFSNSHTT